jgi:O-antigen/teichoic acid export membrane protein
MAIVSPWVFGGAALCVLGLFQLWRLCDRYRYHPQMDGSVARGLFRVGVPNHLLTLTERAPGLVLPIVVTELLSREDNATWYVVWMMAWVVYIVPISVGIALFSELVHKPERYRKTVRHGVQTALAFGAVGALALLALADVALGLFGSAYADGGATPLRLLVFAFVPLTAVQVYYASCRARNRLREAIVAGAVTGLVAVGAAAAVGPEYGLTGMAVAWLATQTAAGAWALLRVRSLARLGAPRRRTDDDALTRAELVEELAPGQPVS